MNIGAMTIDFDMMKNDVNTDVNRNLLLHLHQLVQENEKLKQENKKLKENIRIDALTKVYNRQFMEEYLRDELSRSDRYSSHFSMLILDIDFFKKINDTYGHQVGDFVLKKIADIMKKTLRNSDMIFRYGGEEFLVALPETELKGACRAADKLRKTIEDEIFDTIQWSITVSIGVSERKDNISLDELIHNVDMALYEAKKGGRNQVRVAA